MMCKNKQKMRWSLHIITHVIFLFQSQFTLMFIVNTSLFILDTYSLKQLYQVTQVPREFDTRFLPFYTTCVIRCTCHDRTSGSTHNVCIYVHGYTEKTFLLLAHFKTYNVSLYITLMRHKFLQTKRCGAKELRP